MYIYFLIKMGKLTIFWSSCIRLFAIKYIKCYHGKFKDLNDFHERSVNARNSICIIHLLWVDYLSFYLSLYLYLYLCPYLHLYNAPLAPGLTMWAPCTKTTSLSGKSSTPQKGKFSPLLVGYFKGSSTYFFLNSKVWHRRGLGRSDGE